MQGKGVGALLGFKNLPLPPFTLFARLLVKEVGHARGYLYPMYGTLTALFFSKKKKVSESNPTPPPPLPRGITACKKHLP